VCICDGGVEKRGAFETSGTTRPTTQQHILEDLNIQLLLISKYRTCTPHTFPTHFYYLTNHIECCCCCCFCFCFVVAAAVVVVVVVIVADVITENRNIT
jgi:hypothetical protein